MLHVNTTFLDGLYVAQVPQFLCLPRLQPLHGAVVVILGAC